MKIFFEAGFPLLGHNFARVSL